MVVKILAAFAAALLAAWITGKLLVPKLRAVKAGQMIREDGPTWHISKQGTPTMGGLIFIAAIFVVCFTVGLPSLLKGDYSALFALVFALVFGAIGFLDDYEKLRKKQNLGLTAPQKFFIQLAAAIAFILLLRLTGHLTPNVYVPFFNVYFKLPEVWYFVFAAFVIVGTVNAVNITDGIDGLAAGVSIPVAVCYAAVAALWMKESLGIFAGALAGGLCGFLIFNFHPAKIFMGDTGSLFLGGAVCALAFAMDMPLVLIPLGFVYVVETLSDILQIVYFKLTHGKRIFKMAPIHHHFEMCGWSENKIFAVFTAVSAVFAVLSYLGVFQRYQI